MTSRTVRRIHRVYMKAPSSPIVAKVFRANDRLAAQHSVDQHVIMGLLEALKSEKSKQEKGETAELTGRRSLWPTILRSRRDPSC